MHARFQRAFEPRPSPLSLWVGCCTALLVGCPAVAGTFFPVDLSHHVNYGLTRPMLNVPGNNLAGLGEGLKPDHPLKTLAGVPFRIDGVVLVGPGEIEGGLSSGPVWLPPRVTG